jgi:hypothetical protein
LSIIAADEKQRTIKLESHSRRNNLNFFNIPEKGKEDFSKTETILREFIVNNLSISMDDLHEISIERAHGIEKTDRYRHNDRPRPIIAKFTFFKDKYFVLSKANNLAGSKYGLSEDFPKEIVQVRKSLLPHLKEGRKKGEKAKLVFDKLYVDGQIYIDHSPPECNLFGHEIQFTNFQL